MKKFIMFIAPIFVTGCSYLDSCKTKDLGNGRYQGCLGRNLGINGGNIDWFVLFVIILTVVITRFVGKYYK